MKNVVKGREVFPVIILLALLAIQPTCVTGGIYMDQLCKEQESIPLDAGDATSGDPDSGWDSKFDLGGCLERMHGYMRNDWYDVNSYRPYNFSHNHREFFSKCGEGTSQKRASSMSVVRLEYRQMTNRQRNAFHRVLQTMKTRMIGDTSMYDLFSWQHMASVAPGAHFGAAFPCWHREFMQRFENAMRTIDSTVFLPYMDTSLDDLPNPADSCLFSDDFLGPARGAVVSGPFAGWEVIAGECQRVAVPLTRRVVNQNRLLFHEGKLRYFGEMDSFTVFTSQGEFSFEGAHGETHVLFGGHMASLNCAPNDPAFWMHHCNMDYVFETLRKNQGRAALFEYPSRNPPFHGPDEPMRPHKPRRNADGLRAVYTSENYRYGPRPYNCRVDTDCAPNALWCNRGRCLSKIKLGGRCDRLPHNCCYGYCDNGDSPMCLFGQCRC